MNKKKKYIYIYIYTPSTQLLALNGQISSKDKWDDFENTIKLGGSNKSLKLKVTK